MSDFLVDLENNDLVFNGLDFGIENGLRSAVYISLFTDSRASEEEIDAGQNPRGNWSDYYETIPLGSKLWLLYRRKQTEETRLLAEQYARDSLLWLISAGVAQDVQVVASFPRRGILYLEVDIFRPDKVSFQYSTNWEAEQEAA